MLEKAKVEIAGDDFREGLAQRAKLWMKNTCPPHVLVMTATPIPRTLAMTLYGDLDVSVIDELPPGRKPIQTVHQFDNRRAGLYASIRKQIEEGRQDVWNQLYVRSLLLPYLSLKLRIQD